jgi:competence protein ComEC
VFYLGLALIIPRKTRLHGAGLVALCIIFVGFYPLIRNNAPVEMTFLDVGQGESAVISLPDKKTMVIDTGRDGKQTVSYLDYLGKKTVDALFLTHDGSDHAGGLGYIMTMKRVRAILDNGSIYYSGPLPADIQHISLKRGDVIDGTGYRIETLHPHDGFYSSHSSHAAAENNDCLVLRLRAAGLKALFTGDIESEAEEDMITLGKYLNADILKVAHHGSRSSTTDDFLASANPSIAVISSGMFNSYGHPHEETVRKLSGRKTFNTAECGAIKITARLSEDKKSFRYFIKTFEDYRLREAHNIQDEINNLGKLVMTW